MQDGSAAEDDDEGGFVLTDSYRLISTSFAAGDVPVPVPDEDAAVVFHSHKWDLYNRVHLCSNMRAVL